MSRLTPSELERAIVGLNRLRALRKGRWELRHARRTLKTTTRTLRSTLSELTLLGVLDHDDRDTWGLTPVGEHIVDCQNDKNWRPLTTLFMRAGGIEDDVLVFLREAKKDNDCAVLTRARARSICPTLATVMGWVPEWRDGAQLVVPLDALTAAMAAAAMELTHRHPTWVENREQVGLRAEAYSLRREREQHGVAEVVYVSRDVGDRYGYDLESRAHEPPRLIECKGSRSAGVQFTISAHELNTAREQRDSYEIQYWGNIDLTRSPDEEYEALVESGYPLVIADPAAKIDGGELFAQCASWHVESQSVDGVDD